MPTQSEFQIFDDIESDYVMTVEELTYLDKWSKNFITSVAKTPWHKDDLPAMLLRDTLP